MGAIMAQACDAGQRVVCVTATRGEAGSQDEQRWPPAALGALRARELDAALAILGVTEHRFLDYPDGGCAAVDAAEATARVAAAIADVRPDSVLTFGPDGLTGHPDHQAVSRWASAAFASAAAPDARLCWATETLEWRARFRPVLEPQGVYSAETVAFPRARTLLHVTATGDLRARKHRALLAQESQTSGLFAAIGDPALLLELIAEEAFVAAAP